MNRSIVFLDFEGVVCLEKDWGKHPDADGFPVFDGRAVATLNELVLQTDSSLVVTSSWVRELSLEGIQQVLFTRGVVGPVHSLLPTVPGGGPFAKGRRITLWLEQQTYYDRYVVLDDDPGLIAAGPAVAYRLVRLNPARGLDQDGLRRALDILRE